MASSSIPLAFILLALTPFLFLTTPPQVEAQKAPSPTPPGPANVTGILDKAGQYTTFIRLLVSTQISSQIETQLNSSDQGMTIFAPTDNAFSNLKAGTLNGLSTQDQVSLVLYHILTKYYSFALFETVSNPVRTLATGQDGGAYDFNITSTTDGQQVNVSTGLVTTQLNTVLSKDFPLAMYQVDRVLLPLDLFGPKPPKASPSPPPAALGGKTPVSTSTGPTTSKNADSGSKGMHVGFSGMLVVIGSICMGLL